MHPAEEGAYRDPKPAGWIRFWKEEFRLSKKLKLFGLLALTVALVVGVAWAADTLVLSGNGDSVFTLASAGPNDTNIITGNGTQRAGIVGAAGNEILRLNATEGNMVTIAPVAANVLPAPLNVIQRLSTAAPNNLQVVINANEERGKVVIKASAGDNPTAGGDMTEYNGGTVLADGTLGVTHANSLGQAWVAVRGNPDPALAPVFRTEEVNEVQFGLKDPGGAETRQPFYLLYDAIAGVANDALRYATLNVEQTSSSNNGLMLHHGLDQRTYGPPTFNDAAVDVLATTSTQTAGTYVRLTKTGTGRVWVNGGNPNLAPNAASLLPLDGMFHRGGTVVDGGLLEVTGGLSANPVDHFRGALGKFWTAFEGSLSTPVVPYHARQYQGAVLNAGLIYNPLFINNDARVKVNRSQYFSDFNVAEKASFTANNYTLAAVNYNPQIAVTLDRKYSKANGLLEGEFDLVVFSTNPAAANRPSNDPQNPAITSNAQAVLFINNPENKIFASGDTLVANGVLEIAGAKSIGGGMVTVGATGNADRGFLTPATDLATFASSKTFTLENKAFTKGARAALAAERDATLSFKDITMDGTLTINPGNVLTHTVPFAAPLMPKNWSGTVEFGAASSSDAAYRATGVMINPTNVFVDRGVWQLNSFPTPTATQVANGENPFMDVTLVEGATLSLGKDVNDFRPYMDLTVRNDSRIRLVLRDSDIAATRAEAMGKAPVFAAREINYGAIGYGEANRDRRLAIQLDPSQLTGSTIKKGWIKLVFSDNAVDWNAMHFLREHSDVNYEDYAKVRITWTTKSDIVKNAVAHLDENSYTILVEVGADVTDPVNPGGPTPTPDALTTTLTPSATSVAPGAEVTVTLGEWTYKGASADVVSEDVTVTGGTIKTPLAGKKVVLTAGAEGTMTVTATSVLKSDPKVTGKGTTSITVTKGGGSGKKSSSGGGCDAGFGGLALALAAAFLLKRKA